MAIVWGKVEPPSWSAGGWTRDPQLPALDPYLVWADVTRFADLDLQPSCSKQWVPVILELNEPATAFAERYVARCWDWIRIPSVYRYAPEWLEPTRFCTATVAMQAFEKIDRELKGSIKRLQLGSPVFSETDVDADTRADVYDARGHPCSVCGPGAEADGPLPVVVGIVDEGLAFAHERFREIADGETASRIEFFWNQNADSRHSRPARGFGYGSELSRSDIGQLLRRASHDDQVDEDQLYRQAGHHTVARRLVHGTHVMDLACGEDPREVTARTPRIVCVELPRQTVRDTSGLGLAVHALDAVRYVLDRAACFARAVRGAATQQPCPVVVNLSYGNIAGPHDGSSILEGALDELIGLARRSDRRGNLQVVLPAGNNLLSRCHARVELGAGDEEVLHWRIQPDDATPSFLEIWTREADRGLAIEVMTAAGESSGWVLENEVFTGTVDGDVVCTVASFDRVATGAGRMALVAVAPSVTMSPARRVAPAGTWRIRLRNQTSPDMGRQRPVTVDAWVQRDDAPLGFPRRGRQSRFDDARYVRFDAQGRLKEDDDDAASIVRRDGTLNAIATGDRTIVVGGYREADGAPARYSASGPTLATSRIGPDAMAESERSVTGHGVRGAASRSGARFAMGGTSVAAPRVTRLIAEHMGEGMVLDRQAVVELARQADPAVLRRPKDGRKLKPSAERGGGGRLAIADSEEMLGASQGARGPMLQSATADDAPTKTEALSTCWRT